MASSHLTRIQPIGTTAGQSPYVPRRVVVVRKLPKPKIMFSPTTNSAPICSMLQLSDGTVLSGSLDGLIRSWHINESLLPPHSPSFSSSFSTSTDSTSPSSSSSSTDPYLEKMRFEGHQKRVPCLAEVDENTFVSGSWDCKIKRWRLSDGECLATLSGTTEGVYCLVSLRKFDRKVLVSGSGNHQIHLWSLETNQRLKTVSGHGYAVRSMTELDNGLIATCAFDAKLKVWEVTMQPPPSSLASSATLSVASLHSRLTIECYHKIEDEAKTKLSVVLALKRDLVACATTYGGLKIWNTSPSRTSTTQRGKRMRHLTAIEARAKHGKNICAMARLPLSEYGGEAFVTGSEDGSIRGWNFRAECLFEGRTKLPVHTALCPLRGGLLAASTMSAGETVLLWRFPSRRSSLLERCGAFISRHLSAADIQKLPIPIELREYCLSLWTEVDSDSVLVITA